MITFDTIGLSYDPSYLPNWVKDTVKKSIEEYSRYGLTTLFFEDKVSSVKVLFNEQDDIKQNMDSDGFTVSKIGEDITTYKDKQGNKRTEKTRNLYKIQSWSYLVNMRKQINEISPLKLFFTSCKCCRCLSTYKRNRERFVLYCSCKI